MFKQRTRKQTTFVNTKLSMNGKHSEMLCKLSDKKTTTDQLKCELKELMKRKSVLDQLLVEESEDEGSDDEFEEPREKISQDQFFVLKLHLFEIERRIDEIQKKILNNESDTEVLDYYMNIVDIIHDYFEIEESPERYVQADEQKQPIEPTTNIIIIPILPKTKKYWHRTTDPMSKVTALKNDLIYEYFRRIDPGYIIKYHQQDVKYYCGCGTERVLISGEGIMICPSCGDTQFSIIDNTKISFKDSRTKETNSLSYKKMGHFTEWLNRLEAKKIPRIPEKVFQEIKNQLINRKGDEFTKITPKKLRTILKKLGYSEYYEDVSYIMSQITGLVPPTLNQGEREILRIMFREVEVAWRKVKPHDRNNFLNYPYVLRKLLELLGHDNYLDYFSLSDSNDKLKTMDSLWKSLCKILQYEFIPSRRKMDEFRY